MGPRCSSAETQVCHRSYIIAARPQCAIFLFFILSELECVLYKFVLRLKSEANSRENTIKHLFSELKVEKAAREDERKQKDDVLTRYI